MSGGLCNKRDAGIYVKRIITVIIITAFILGIMGGCSSNGSNTGIDDINVGKALEPVDINYYTVSYGQNEPTNADAIKDMLEQVRLELKDNLKVNVKYNWIKYDELNDKFEQIINSGEPVDAVTTFNISELAQRKLLMDLTELFPKYAPAYYKELEAGGFDKDTYLSADKNLYTVPNNYVESPRYCIMLRKDMADKYAPEGFETLEDYGRFLEAVKKNEKNIQPGLLDSYSFIQAYIEGNGFYTNGASYFYSRYTDKSMEVFPVERLAEMTKAYQLLKKWKSDEFIAPRGDSINPMYSLGNGKIISQLFPMRSIHDYLQNMKFDYEYTIYPLYMKSKAIVNRSTFGIAVGKTSRIPERVLMFIEWLHSSQKAYDLFMYGVKEKNYFLKGEKLDFPDSIYSRDLMLANRSDAMYLKDARYERIYSYEPDNAREIYTKSITANVLTYEELFDRLDMNMETALKDEERAKRLQKEYEAVNPIFDKYFENMKSFIMAIDMNDFSKTPDMLVDEQKEIGVDKIIESRNKITKELKEAGKK